MIFHGIKKMNNLLPYTECLLQLILSNLLVFLLILFLNYLKILNIARKMLNFPEYNLLFLNLDLDSSLTALNPNPNPTKKP